MRRGRRAARPGSRGGLLVCGLLVASLTACSDLGDTGSPGPATGHGGEPGSPGQPGSAGQPGRNGGISIVACSGNSCSVSLGGNGSARILGTTVSVRLLSDGRAVLRVGDRDVSCTEGQTVSAGPLSLRCTAATRDGVRFSAALR